jgi:large subunit ribosomal protein L29
MAAHKELRTMTVDELNAKAGEVRIALARLSMKRHARRLDRTSDLKLTKKELARVLTMLRQKQLAEPKEVQ